MNATNQYAIAVERLGKKFNGFTAVDRISFKVREGEIFGLLGPNGAGKTTTISMLATIINSTSGTAKVYGRDINREKDAVRGLIGIVFQDPSLDDQLTGRQNLDFHARLYGVKGAEKKEAIQGVLRLVGLESTADRLVKTYSGGMKRRLEIARGFIHKPKVLFLDEPTIGLDPQTRRNIWDYIEQINRGARMTIILTTHYMEEADELCGRIAIIDHGRIIKLDTSERLKDSLGGDIVRMGTSMPKELAALMRLKRLAAKVRLFGDAVEITTRNGSEAIPRIIGAAKAARIGVEYATLKRPTLEDVFINLTGKQIREESASGAEMLKSAMAWHGRR